MFKRALKISVSLTLVFLLSVGSVFANPLVAESTPGDTTYTPLNQESVKVTNDDNNSSSINQQSIGIQAAAMGVIACQVVNASTNWVECDWTVAVLSDKINYSNISVTLEKWDASQWKWVYVSKQTFDYGVNPPKATISDVAQYSLIPDGRYRVKLGGTFTAVEKGVYGATADNPANFEV